MSGKSNNVEAASRVYFPLPDLSRKIERDSARRVERVYICPKKFLYQLTVQILLDLEVYRMLKNDAVSGVPSVK